MAVPDPNHVATACAAVARVLAEEDLVVRDLMRYYDPADRFVGATFDAPDTNPAEITPLDLVAVSSMNIEIPALGVRHLLEPGESRSAVLRALNAVDDIPLWEADDTLLDRAGVLHTAVKRAVSDGNAWVTASKITARKRPSLIPVRDSVIVRGLGLPNRDYMTDWLIIREVVRDPAVRDRLRSCAASASSDWDLTDIPVLRLLDAALWVAWRRGGSRSLS